MAYMYVDIDLTEVDDSELIDEITARGFNVIEPKSTTTNEALEKIYHLRRIGMPYQDELDAYIMDTLGKVI